MASLLAPGSTGSAVSRGGAVSGISCTTSGPFKLALGTATLKPKSEASKPHSHGQSHHNKSKSKRSKSSHKSHIGQAKRQPLLRERSSCCGSCCGGTAACAGPEAKPAPTVPAAAAPYGGTVPAPFKLAKGLCSIGAPFLVKPQKVMTGTPSTIKTQSLLGK